MRSSILTRFRYQASIVAPQILEGVMSRLSTNLFAVAAIALLSACVSTQATRLGSGTIRPPVPPDQVAIYRTADQVPRKYEEVALLSSKGDYSMTDEEKMYRSMREKAGEMGANAIILQSVQDREPVQRSRRR